MGAYDTPLEKCPYCNAECDADWVDVGVGMVQCGPYYCEQCGASEIGPEGKANTDSDEQKTGWYKGGKISPYANAIGGVLVDHKTARNAYIMGMLDEKPYL